MRGSDECCLSDCCSGVDAEGATSIGIRSDVLPRYRQKVSVRGFIRAKLLLTSGSRRGERSDSNNDDGLQELHLCVGMVGERVEVLDEQDLCLCLLYTRLCTSFVNDHS
jgi:hypothetical protein